MMTTLDRRTLQAFIGAVAVLLVGGMAAIGIRVALGDFADEYEISATTVRTGFGLDAASAVKIRGIGVGRVERVELQDDGTVALTLAIRDGIAIPADAAASVEPVSVFGPKFVDIRPGGSETAGPFLADGDALGAIVEPSELTETLDAVSQVLDVVDPEDLAVLLAELARGVDGLGPELGATIDSSADVVGRLARVRPQLEALLRDTDAVVQALAEHAEDVVSIADDSRPLLDLVAANEDPLADLLRSTSGLTARVGDLLDESGTDLAGLLIGVEGGVRVLAEQLALLPDFVDGLDAVSDALGSGLFAWERGPGLWGLIGHGYLDFEPCTFAYRTGCPDRPGYEERNTP